MLQHVAATRRAVLTANHNLTWHVPLRYYTSTHKNSASNNKEPKAFRPHVQAHSKGPKTVHIGRLLQAIFQPNPLPFNCTTHPSTPMLAGDPANVLGMKIRHRKANFDPEQFIWVARCPVDLVKKSTYRHALCKRARSVFLQELEKRGWNKDGKLMRKEDEPEEVTNSEMKDLKGALLIMVGRGREKDKAKIVNAKKEEIREDLEPVFTQFLEPQMSAGKPQGGSIDNNKRWQSDQVRQDVTVQKVARQLREERHRSVEAQHRPGPKEDLESRQDPPLRLRKTKSSWNKSKGET